MDQTLRRGRVVRYTTEDGREDSAAIVTRVVDQQAGVAELRVVGRDGEVGVRTGVRWDEGWEAGTWHWPLATTSFG